MAQRYEAELKKQIVALYNNGKSLSTLQKEYGISKSTIKNWVERYNTTKSFDVNDNRSEAEKELIKLRKEIKQLKMENDILKQAALILGKKST